MTSRTPLRSMCLSRQITLGEAVEFNSIPVTESGCWLWLLSQRRFGHGQLRHNYQNWPAHRASWTAFRGAIPKGLHVLHKCNVASCVNPDHLYLGTDLENCADRVKAGTQAIPPRMVGEAHPMAKITMAIARAIRAATGTGPEIAARFNINKQTVHAIRSGRQWRETHGAS